MTLVRSMFCWASCTTCACIAFHSLSVTVTIGSDEPCDRPVATWLLLLSRLLGALVRMTRSCRTSKERRPSSAMISVLSVGTTRISRPLVDRLNRDSRSAWGKCEETQSQFGPCGSFRPGLRPI